MVCEKSIRTLCKGVTSKQKSQSGDESPHSKTAKLELSLSFDVADCVKKTAVGKAQPKSSAYFRAFFRVLSMGSPANGKLTRLPISAAL